MTQAPGPSQIAVELDKLHAALVKQDQQLPVLLTGDRGHLCRASNGATGPSFITLLPLYRRRAHLELLQCLDLHAGEDDEICLPASAVPLVRSTVFMHPCMHSTERWMGIEGRVVLSTSWH
jgi:hypothetical protein